MKVPSIAELARSIANARVYDVARKTPLELAENLSERVGNRIYLKREDLQRTHSFKLRGSHNRIANLDSNCKGIIAASAGNHSQGVALSAQKLGLPCTLVMPLTTPRIKVDAAARFGPEIILHGDSFDQAKEHALALAASEDMQMIHPFDDALVIAGQGTVAREICDEKPDLDLIFIPVGGGGLLAGMAAWIKHLHPDCQVVAVEPTQSACFQAAQAAGKPVDLENVDAFADGVAVRRVGELSFAIASPLVDAAVTVDNDAICAAVKIIFENTRAIAEPAGALALAGALAWVREKKITDKSIAVVVSGANIDFHNLRHISERTELGENLEAVFAVTIPERPGSFARLCAALGKRSITEFNYRYDDRNEANIFLGIQTLAGKDDRDEILGALASAGFSALDLSENETAKLHLRYLVGGRSHAQDENLFRFEFPERPGALLDFLSTLGDRWNISLFHYRNHGAAMGRVLAGFQVPTGQYDEILTCLAETGYPFWEENENPACKLFLSLK